MRLQTSSPSRREWRDTFLHVDRVGRLLAVRYVALSLDSLVVNLISGKRTLREEVGVGHGLGDRRQPHGAAFVVAGDQVFVSEQLFAVVASLEFAHCVVVIVAERERLLHVFC